MVITDSTMNTFVFIVAHDMCLYGFWDGGFSMIVLIYRKPYDEICCPQIHVVLQKIDEERVIAWWMPFRVTHDWGIMNYGLLVTVRVCQ